MKYYGKIGFAVTEEVKPGVWQEQIVEKDYYGDVEKMTKRYENSQNLNDNININNVFSILSDPFANDNFQNMRYISWMGTNWKITGIEVQFPRFVLTVGGVYNGKQT